MPIKISIVGTNESLMALLKAETNLEFYNSYSTGEEAVRDIPVEKPDLILVDFRLPCMDGFECVRKLKVLLPSMPVLMFTSGMESNLELIFSSLHAGANGYLPKYLPPGELAGAIKQAHKSARRRGQLFLMFFDSDVQFEKTARHWGKIPMMLNAPAVTIMTVNYGGNWRKTAISSKVISKKPRLNSRRLTPPFDISNRALVTV